MKQFYQDWFDHLYKGGYYELGHPHRSVRDCDSATDLMNYVGRNSGNKDLYMSLFKYKRLENGKPDYESLVFDRLCIDIDFDYQMGDSECRRVYELLQFFDDLEWEYWIHYTGGRGFHIYFTFPPLSLDNRNNVIRQLKHRLTGKMSAVDNVAFNSQAQMIRIPNTQHTTTGLYCVPIKTDYLLAGIDTIQKISTTPNWNHSPKRFDNRQLVETLESLDTPVSTKRTTNVDTSNVKCDYIDKMSDGLKYGNRDNGLSFLILRLKQAGKDRYQTLQFVRDWNKNNEPPLSDSHLSYKVRYFYNNDYDSVGPCWFAKQIFDRHCQNCRW